MAGSQAQVIGFDAAVGTEKFCKLQGIKAYWVQNLEPGYFEPLSGPPTNRLSALRADALTCTHVFRCVSLSLVKQAIPDQSRVCWHKQVQLCQHISSTEFALAALILSCSFGQQYFAIAGFKVQLCDSVAAAVNVY